MVMLEFACDSETGGSGSDDDDVRSALAVIEHELHKLPVDGSRR